MKRLFQKNKGYEPTPFVTEPPPAARTGNTGTHDHANGGHPRPSVGAHPTPSSRYSPDPQYTLEHAKQQHAQQPPPVAASAKKWFNNLNGKQGAASAAYDQITPFTMPQQPQGTTESSTSVDRQSWHDPPAAGARYPGGMGHPGKRTDGDGLVPPPAAEQQGNVKRRVSLRDHASNRMFGWSSRDKHKEAGKKPSAGGAGGDAPASAPVGGAKVISGQRYEDTAYPASGPIPVAKDAAYQSGRAYGQVYSPQGVNMSRGTTHSAEVGERRGSSGSMGHRHEYPQFTHDALLSPTGPLPPPLPLSQQHSRSSQQSLRQYPHPGVPSPGFQSASPGTYIDPAALQRPISMAKLNAEHWSPASSEHELLVPRDAHQLASSPAPLAGREGYAHLAAPPVLAESARPASPRHHADAYHYRPSVDQSEEHWYGRGDENAHAEDGKNHHKKKGLFGFVVGGGGGGAKDKGAEREKDKPSDWTGFLRKKEPRIEYRGPEYTDHTTMTDASYAEVMPVAYAGVAQPVKVLEVPKKDRELAIREAQERTKEAQRAEKQRLKEEERRMKDEEKRAREEEKERARADKELAKRKEDGKVKARDPKSVSYEIDELCNTAYAGDLSKIYNIGDKLFRCDKAVHKEAVHATRKQIKHGATPEAKVFALKIWLLIADFDRSESGFRVLSFEKKFLAAIEDQLLNTDDGSRLPPATFDRMRDTLSHLCFHYGRLPGGENLRHSWHKVKRPDEPQEGYSFPETHPVFSPQDPLLRPSPSNPNHLQHLDTVLPDDIQQLTKLVEECKAGNEQARALQEALLMDSQHSKKGEINKLYSSCARALEELESQMSWANSQAEQSRLERGLSTPADFGISFEDQLDGHRVDPKSGSDDLPLAERAFGDLLAACDALTNAIKLYEDAERASRESEELRYAQEKSKIDTRMGRSSHEGGLSVPQGRSTYVGGSASRSPSPSRAFDARYNGNYADNARNHAPSNGAHSPYSNGVPLSRTPTTAESLDMPPPRFPEDGRPDSPPRNGARVLGPRPFRERGKYGSSTSLQSSQQHHSSSQKNNFVVRNGTDDDDDDEALSRPPARPSSKALGKRPAKEISTFDPDDIWKVDQPKRPESPTESDTSFEDWLLRKPEKYVYDAMQDKEVQRRLAEERRKKTDPSRRKTLESGYGGSQYISTGMNAQLVEIKKALGNEAPSKSPAGSRNSSRAASPVPEHAGMQRTTSSRWKWRK